MKVNGLELGARPLAAAVLTGSIRTPVVKKALRQGADILEVRIDTFPTLDKDSLAESMKKLKDLTKDTRTPVLLTVRSAREGAASSIPDKRRLEIFNSLMRYSDMVDIELSSSGLLKNVVESAHKLRKKVVISYHNFGSTPGNKTLLNIMTKARASGADIVKIAAMARRNSDVRRLADLLSGSDDLIVIAMGEAGAYSRVFFPFIGSLLTYGSIEASTAPGQIPLKAIKYEFRKYGFR